MGTEVKEEGEDKHELPWFVQAAELWTARMHYWSLDGAQPEEHMGSAFKGSSRAARAQGSPVCVVWKGLMFGEADCSRAETGRRHGLHVVWGTSWRWPLRKTILNVCWLP